MNTKWLFVLSATALAGTLLLATVPPALAFPPLPSSFYGAVKADGANVPLGTRVSAWIGGVEYAWTTVSLYLGDTVYSLDVPGDDLGTLGMKEGGAPGETVVFYIGHQEASQTAPWQSGTNVRLDLTPKPGGETLSYLIYLPIVSNNYRPAFDLLSEPLSSADR